MLNGGGIAGGSQEMLLLNKFLRQSQRLLAYRAEWAMWAEDESLAGSIDFVTRDMDGRLVLWLETDH